MMLQQHQGLIGGGGGGGGGGNNSGDSAAAAAAAAAQAQEYSGIGGELGGGGAGSGGFSEEERGGGRIDDGERNSGGNRWPRQETLALLKIRSDMDTVFRDSSLKGPLWDEVSRKLAELGYHRSAKKCKEKFENVYKYHKRTKDGRTSKADGKTYRFFDQLEALETTSHPPPLPASAKPFLQAVPPLPNTNGGGGGGGGANTTAPPPPPPQPNAVSSSAAPQVITTVPSSAMNNVAGATVAVNHPAQPQQQQAAQNHGFMFSNVNAALSNYSTSSSSSTDSEEPVEKRRKRKRKWKDFFGRLMKEVIDKQEELQSKFLETLEKRERERIAREEAWRVQEMAKMNREHDMLVQERSIAAAKDAAVISFLQKIAEQQQNSPAIPTTPQSQSQPQSQPPPTAPVPAITPPPAAAQIPFQLTIQPQPAPPPPQPSGIQQQRHQQPPAPTVVPAPVPVPGATPISLPPVIKNLELTGKAIVSAAADNGGGGDLLSPSPSRWPKAEVQALINLRTTLDVKYQENGPKGPLWEEISSSMKKLGYNRNAKRCKEKWENINKYYKKVKESSKKRPEDSKTCPYFHQLDAIYREKANSGFGSAVPKPENQQAAPIMARPEQQWPPSIDQQRSESAENMDQNDEDEDDDDDEDEAGEYEIVTNKTSTMATSIE